MFSENVCAAHEPQASQLIESFFAWHHGRVSDRELTAWIRARDHEMALEVDVSWLNVLILRFLVEEFPHARFVLTIRDCYSWLNSEFRRVLYKPSARRQRVELRKFLYDPANAAHAPEEGILQEAGLYPIDRYLCRWAAHNTEVLATVPEERLLVVRTDHIKQRAGEIADFAGLPHYSIRLHQAHEGRNPVKRTIIREIDREFLERKTEQHCRGLMKRFFPEIKSLDDAIL
jgi:hypothetical protein